MRGGVPPRPPLSDIEAAYTESRCASLARRYHRYRWRRRFDLIHGAFIALLLGVAAVALATVIVLTTIYLLRYYL